MEISRKDCELIIVSYSIMLKVICAKDAKSSRLTGYVPHPRGFVRDLGMKEESGENLLVLSLRGFVRRMQDSVQLPCFGMTS